MSTRDFSSIKLPQPRYLLEVGKFLLPSVNQAQEPVKPTQNGDGDVQQQTITLPPSCLPRYSNLAQLVEVRLPGYTIPGRPGQHIKDFLGSHVVIDNARPELFLRRDFISKFVNKGRIFLSRISQESKNDVIEPEYDIEMTENNVLHIILSPKQYRRFGMIGKSVVNHATKEHSYRIDIDLKDERIMRNNRFQDKMINTLRRLNSINKVYFRFVPDDDASGAITAEDLSVEYFKYVIEEYALDGCEPVPLGGCSAVCQRIERHWLNCAQLHPNLDLDRASLREEERAHKIGGRSMLDDTEF